MDCRTARILLDFARPSAMELPASDATDLEGHLNGCSECDTLARTDRLLDSRLSQPLDLSARRAEFLFDFLVAAPALNPASVVEMVYIRLT